MSSLSKCFIKQSRGFAMLVACCGATSLAQAQQPSRTAGVAQASAPSAPVGANGVNPSASNSAGSQAAPPVGTAAEVASPPLTNADASTPSSSAVGTEESQGVTRPPSGQSAVPRKYVVPRVIGYEPQAPPGPPPGPPKVKYPIGLELNFMPVWLTNRGYDLFSSNDVSMRVGLSLDAELIDVTTNTPLAVEVGWTSDSQQARSLFSGFDSDYSAQNLHGGLKLSHRVTSFLAPHVRLAGGASSVVTNFTATSASVTREFESHTWVAFGTLGAGVTAVVPTRSVVQPALTLEGGYLLSGAIPLKLEPDVKSSGTSSLATAGASLGTLERSGPYLRIGVAIRY